MKPYYVTTPIYYVNDYPHIGTGYSTIAADVLSRYARLRGRLTRFSTGLDENGLKIERRAREENIDPKAFVDRMAQPFREAWVGLGCNFDDFIRTTESRHQERVKLLWQRIKDAGDIYLGEYEDWYCVGCEGFYTEKDLLPGNICPQHLKPVERFKEVSYFFRLSKYQERLLRFYEEHPEFVRPPGRYNEVKSVVKEGLRDLSISRTTFRWGIPVPDDAEHVMYVWFDALTNYISGLGGPAAPGAAPLYDLHWPPHGEVVHLVGKDILRFHAIYWPAFLLSAGIEPPSQIWAHGWLTVNGEKMSKTLGNFLRIEPLVEAFGADVLRYYLMREIALGQDGDFSFKNLIARYNGDLANGVGNLLSRVVVSLVKKNLGGMVPPRPSFDQLKEEDRALMATAERCAQNAAEQLTGVAPHRALEAIFELVAAANKYVDQTAPWVLVKKGETARLEQVIYTALETLRWISLMLWPFMPSKADQLRQQLGLSTTTPTVGVDLWPSAWGGLSAGLRTDAAQALFPRIDKELEKHLYERFGVSVSETVPPQTKPHAPQPPAAALPPAPALAAPAAPVPGEVQPAAPTGQPPVPIKGEVTFDEFAKIDLRVALVLTAETVPKSDKLLRLEVDVGEGKPRQILAGIARHYQPEQLIGKRIVVVANLKPRQMMGRESRGMVLAASDSGKLDVVMVLGEAAPGSTVS
jgi:methionyl-tRNA synthetase